MSSVQKKMTPGGNIYGKITTDIIGAKIGLGNGLGGVHNIAQREQHKKKRDKSDINGLAPEFTFLGGVTNCQEKEFKDRFGEPKKAVFGEEVEIVNTYNLISHPM